MDFYSLAYNLLFISFLGLLVAFNPLLIVVDFLLILKSRRPIFNSILLVAGFACAISLLFVLASLIIDPDSQISLRKLKDNLDIPPLIDLIAGGTLIAYGLKKYQRLTVARSPKSVMDFELPQMPKQIFAFGFVKAILSLTNIFAVFILARQAVVSQWSLALGLVAVIWLLVIGILPLVYMMYLHWFKKESLGVIDSKLTQLLTRDTTNLLAYALILIGVFFVTKGVFGLNH